MKRAPYYSYPPNAEVRIDEDLLGEVNDLNGLGLAVRTRIAYGRRPGKNPSNPFHDRFPQS